MSYDSATKGYRESRYVSLNEGMAVLRDEVNNLEDLVDQIAGPQKTGTGIEANIKASPDPQNIAFLIQSLPMILKSFTTRIISVKERLQDAFV